MDGRAHNLGAKMNKIDTVIGDKLQKSAPFNQDVELGTALNIPWCQHRQTMKRSQTCVACWLPWTRPTQRCHL